MYLYIFLITAAAVLCWRIDAKRGFNFQSRNVHMRNVLGETINRTTNSEAYLARYRALPPTTKD